MSTAPLEKKEKEKEGRVNVGGYLASKISPLLFLEEERLVAEWSWLMAAGVQVTNHMAGFTLRGRARNTSSSDSFLKELS